MFDGLVRILTQIPRASWNYFRHMDTLKDQRLQELITWSICFLKLLYQLKSWLTVIYNVCIDISELH